MSDMLKDRPEQIMLGAIFMFLQEQGFEPTWTDPFPSNTFAIISKPVDEECAPSTFRVNLVQDQLMLTRTATAITLYKKAFYGGEIRFLELADPGLFDRIVEVLS